MGRGEGVTLQKAPRRKKAPHKQSNFALARRKRKRHTRHVATLERTTHKGVPCSLQLWEDIDDGIKSAWTVDMVEVYVEGEPAGYLKISYIKSETFKEMFPTLLHYVVEERGMYLALEEILVKDASAWNKDELLKAVNATSYFLTSQEQKDNEAMSEAELQSKWRQRMKRLEADYGEQFRAFKNFHVDKPLVDFSRVYTERESDVWVSGKRTEREKSENHQRKGLALVMYETAALWARSRGLKLFASGVQSDSAQGVWRVLEEKGLIKTSGTRRVFDTEELLERDPSLEIDLS